MNVSTVKAVATYTIAGIVVVGGLIIVYQTRLETTADELRLLIAGFIGATIQFLYQQETQTRTAVQTATATAAGAQNTGTTVVAQPPSQISVQGTTSADPAPPVVISDVPADADTTLVEEG